jgi:hypothetical protein
VFENGAEEVWSKRGGRETRDNYIALMMEAARTSETSVDNYFTRQYIPEDKSELQTRRRENLKSHTGENCLMRTFIVCTVQ